MSLAVGGAFLLFVGWLGFNRVASYGTDHDAGLIIADTVFAGCDAGTFAIVFNLLRRSSVNVKNLINAILAGLVSSCATAHLINPSGAVLLGIAGYWVMLGLSALLEFFEIDDGVDAVPVHMGGGIVGTLVPALILDEVSFSVQFAGLAVGLLWSFGVSYAVLRVVNRYWSLRVTPEAERLGLNIYEHGERNDLSDLIGSIKDNQNSGNLTRRLPASDATEAGVLSGHYNRLLESIEVQQAQVYELLEDSRRLQRVKDEFIATLNHEIRTPITAVKGFAAQLLNSVKPNSQEYDLSSRVLRAGERLEEMSHQLLSVEQIDTSEIVPHLDRLLESVLVDRISIDVESQCSAEGVKLEVLSDEELHSFRDFACNADLRLVDDLVHELIGNALKFGEDGAIQIGFKLDCHEDDYFSFSVRS